MPPHQFAERVLIVIDKDSRDEVAIGQLHSRRLRYRRHIVLLSLQLPHQEITRANQEGNKPDAPRAALPIVHGAEEDHQAEANHREDHATAHVGALSLCGRRIQQGLRHWLPFFHH